MTSSEEPIEADARPLDLRAAVRVDFADSSGRQRLALVAVVFWIAYEWGAGNETVTPWLVARTISSTSGWTSILITSLVGFGFTFVQQLVSGFIALVGFSMFGRTADAAWVRLRGRLHREPTSWSDLGVASRTVLVFGLGTTAVVLIETVTSGSVSRQRHRGTVVQSATLCAIAVGLIAALAAGLAYIGRQNDSMRGTTELILRILGNPLLWIGLIVVVIAVQYVQSSRSAPKIDAHQE